MPCEQFVHAVAPETPENEPAGHDTHTLAPVTFEYVPAEQLVHAVAPAAAYFPTSHATHALFTVR
jgi:hypothetical protein